MFFFFSLYLQLAKRRVHRLWPCVGDTRLISPFPLTGSPQLHAPVVTNLTASAPKLHPCSATKEIHEKKSKGFLEGSHLACQVRIKKKITGCKLAETEHFPEVYFD